MSPPVTVHRLSSGSFEVRCGGCMLQHVTVAAADEDSAWLEMTRQGWTAYRWNEHAHAYAKCPACSTMPGGDVPRRKPRRHR